MKNNNEGEKEPPQPGDPGVFVVQDSNWLKAKDGFKGREKTHYTEALESVPLLTEEKLSPLLAEERKLREQVKVLTARWDTPVEIAAGAKEMNLVEVLQEWAQTHKRNRALVMKRGNADILMTPKSQLLLEAVELL